MKKNDKISGAEEEDSDDEDNLKLSTLAKKKNLLNNDATATTANSVKKDKNSIDSGNKERVPYQPLLLTTLYQYQTTASAGRGVRGRDTICYEKRESTIKVNNLFTNREFFSEPCSLHLTPTLIYKCPLQLTPILKHQNP